MAGKRLIWVDVGMAVAVGLFIAIVTFGRDLAAFVAMMLVYAAALVAWAFVAELGEVRAEEAAKRSRREPLAHTATEPILH